MIDVILRDSVLSWAKHLNGLASVLYSDLVVKDRARLARKVGGDDGEERGEAVF